MTDVFLHLELDSEGVRAKIIEPGQTQTIIRDECQVLYESDSFDQILDVIAQKIDLSMCSTAVILVPDNLVSFRSLELPFKSESKIRKILPFELETVLPDPEAEYISDFLLLDYQNEPYSILSASIQEFLVKQYFSTLDRFRIKPLVISSTGYAAAVSFLSLQTASPNFIFLHISQHLMTVVVVNNEKPSAVRSFSSHNMDAVAVAKLIKQTLLGFSQRTGISYEFELFISSDNGEMLHAQVYKAFDDIMDYHKDLTDNRYKIESESLLCSIRPDRKQKYLFNFCRGKYSTNSFIKTYLNKIGVTAALCLGVLILMLMNVGIDNSRLKAQEQKLDQKAAQIFGRAFPGKKVVNDVYMEMKANVRAFLEKKPGVPGPGAANREIKVVAMMTELSEKIDASMDVEIDRFLYSEQRLVLSGATDNYNNVDNIKLKLESSDLFKKVTISSAASDKRENRVNFKFVIDL